MTHWSNGCHLSFHVDECIYLDKTWKFVSKFTARPNDGEILRSPFDTAPRKWKQEGLHTGLRTRHVYCKSQENLCILTFIWFHHFYISILQCINFFIKWGIQKAATRHGS